MYGCCHASNSFRPRGESPCLTRVNLAEFLENFLVTLGFDRSVSVKLSSQSAISGLDRDDFFDSPLGEMGWCHP